jgi:hypothetical protein
MNKPEIVINIEDIYNRDKYNNINKNLLDKNDNDNDNNLYSCYNFLERFFCCFL